METHSSSITIWYGAIHSMLNTEQSATYLLTSYSVVFSLVVTLIVCTLRTNFLIVLLKSSQVLTGF
jgi:hypothetical protein